MRCQSPETQIASTNRRSIHLDCRSLPVSKSPTHSLQPFGLLQVVMVVARLALLLLSASAALVSADEPQLDIAAIAEAGAPPQPSSKSLEDV